MTNSKDITFGPRPIDTYIITLRSLLAFCGAFGGGLLIFLIYLFAGKEIFYQTTGPWALLFFLIGSLIFNLATNLPAIWLQTIADREKFYRNRTGHLCRVFAINIFIFLLFAIIYFGAFLFKPQLMSHFFITQFFITAIISILTFDTLAGPRYVLQAIFGTTLGAFLSLVLITALQQSSFLIYALLGLPTLWFSLAFGNTIMESISYQIYTLYGINLFEVNEN